MFVSAASISSQVVFLTFVWCEVITEGVVGGGDDVVNFRANLKLKFAHSECPLTAPVRLGIALAGFVHLPFERKILRDKTSTLAENQR